MSESKPRSSPFARFEPGCVLAFLGLGFFFWIGAGVLWSFKVSRINASFASAHGTPSQVSVKWKVTRSGVEARGEAEAHRNVSSHLPRSEAVTFYLRPRLGKDEEFRIERFEVRQFGFETFDVLAGEPFSTRDLELVGDKRWKIIGPSPRIRYRAKFPSKEYSLNRHIRQMLPWALCGFFVAALAVTSSGISALALRASLVATAIALAANAIFGLSDVLCEALLLLSGGLWLSRRSVVRVSVSAMPKPHRFFTIGLLILMVGGHLVGRNPTTFPFPGWDMYTRAGQERPTTESYRLVAIDAQGRTRELDLVAVFGAMGGHAGYALRTLFLERDPEMAGVAALRAELIRWIAADYNKQAQGQPAREIQVHRLVTVIHPSPGQASQTTEIVGKFEIGGDE